MRRLDLNDIRLLMQVVEHGSYTAAARATGVPKSTISQRIATLEQAAGTGLLRRTSRSFSLTEAGANMLPHARAIEELAREVERSLQPTDGELQGTLRVSTSIAVSQEVLSPIVPDFLARHGRVAIRVEASNRLVDMIGEGFDMIVRAHIGGLKDSNLRQRVVARTPWSLAASPDWLALHNAPIAPEDLAGSDTLCFSTTGEASAWALEREEERHVVPVSPRLISDDMLTLRASAIAGGGVTCLPSYLLRGAIEEGRLNRVLPGWTAQTSTISVLTPPRAQSSRLASEFSTFLAEQAPRLMVA